MAQNSFAMKGWAVTLVSAILLVAYEIAGWQYLLIALLPAFVFWGYDAFYLRRERLFICHYDFIRSQSKEDWQENPFSLDISPHKNTVNNWFKTCWSCSIAWLYLPMIFLILAVTFYTAYFID